MDTTNALQDILLSIRKRRKASQPPSGGGRRLFADDSPSCGPSAPMTPHTTPRRTDGYRYHFLAEQLARLREELTTALEENAALKADLARPVAPPPTPEPSKEAALRASKDEVQRLKGRVLALEEENEALLDGQRGYSSADSDGDADDLAAILMAAKRRDEVAAKPALVSVATSPMPLPAFSCAATSPLPPPPNASVSTSPPPPPAGVDASTSPVAGLAVVGDDDWNNTLPTLAQRPSAGKASRCSGRESVGTVYLSPIRSPAGGCHMPWATPTAETFYSPPAATPVVCAPAVAQPAQAKPSAPASTSKPRPSARRRRRKAPKGDDTLSPFQMLKAATVGSNTEMVSFSTIGTGASVLDTLSDNVCRDVLQAYWDMKPTTKEEDAAAQQSAEPLPRSGGRRLETGAGAVLQSSTVLNVAGDKGDAKPKSTSKTKPKTKPSKSKSKSKSKSQRKHRRDKVAP